MIFNCVKKNHFVLRVMIQMTIDEERWKEKTAIRKKGRKKEKTGDNEWTEWKIMIECS